MATRKNNKKYKKFRRARSKRQRGGGVQEDNNLLEAVKGNNVSIEFKKSDEVRAALEKKGVNVNATDDDGNTALYWASKKGYTKIVAMLLEKGADVNATDNDGNTALYWASNNGHKETADLIKTYIQRGGAKMPPDMFHKKGGKRKTKRKSGQKNKTKKIQNKNQKNS